MTLSIRILIFVLALCGGVIASAQATARQIRLVEDLRIDGEKNDLNSFGNIAVSARGEIAIAFQQDGNVRIFSSTGRPVATVGRRGQGPGEFGEYLGSPAWIADTVWISDIDHQRETFITRTGRILRTVSVPRTDADGGVLAPGEKVSYLPWIRNADGSSIGGSAVLAPPSRGGTRGGSPPRGLRKHGVGTEINGRATLVALIPETDRWQEPLAQFVIASYSPDGSKFAFATVSDLTMRGSSITLTVFRLNGDTVFTKSFPYAGIPLPRRVADSLVAGVRHTDADGRRIPSPSIDPTKIPPVFAPISGRLTFGADGRIWIPLREPDGLRALGVDARGNAIGWFRIPPLSRIGAANATHVWMIDRNADDVQSIVRYRITN